MIVRIKSGLHFSFVQKYVLNIFNVLLSMPGRSLWIVDKAADEIPCPHGADRVLRVGYAQQTAALDNRPCTWLVLSRLVHWVGQGRREEIILVFLSKLLARKTEPSSNYQILNSQYLAKSLKWFTIFVEYSLRYCDDLTLL